MTTRAARSYVRTLLVAALVPAVGLVLIAVTAFVVHRVQLARMRALYDELVATNESWEYPRAPDPPGWELEPGSAAELYEAALEACPQAASSASTNQDLNRALRAMAWDTLSPEGRTDLAVPGARPVPAACVEAGVPGNSVDPVLAQLSATDCQLLVECAPAVELLLSGSRSQDARSPGWVWSDWDVDVVTGIEKNMRSIWLGKLAVLHGYVAERGGARGAWAAASMGAIRQGGDMSRGAGYMPGMLSCSMRETGADSVRSMLRRGIPGAEEAERLRRELAYVNRQPLDHGQLFEGDVLMGIGLMGYPRDGDPLPPASRSMRDLGPISWRDRLYMAMGTGSLHRAWRELLAAQDLSYLQRLAAYDRIDDAVGRGAVAVQGYSYVVGGIDAQITGSNTYLELLELAAAATAVRERTGSAPPSLRALLALDGDLPAEDRFTGEPYQVLLEGDLCVIRSPAAAAERKADVGFDRLPNFHPGDRLSVEIPANASAPEPAPRTDEPPQGP